MKNIFLTIFCFLVASAAFGYWNPLPLEELAGFSDYIVVGEVKGLVADTKSERVRVTLHVLECMKGDAPAGKELEFEAPFCLNTDVGSDMIHINGESVRHIMLNSFHSNEVCAVFLRKNTRKVEWNWRLNPLRGSTNPSVSNSYSIKTKSGSLPLHNTATIPLNSLAIQMTNESDGKFMVDWTNRVYWHAMTSKTNLQPLTQIKTAAKAPEKVAKPVKIQWAPGTRQ